VVPPRLGINPQWGAAGLTASAGIAGWCEFALLRHALNRRIGPSEVGVGRLLRLWTAALAAALVGWGLRVETSALHPIVRAAVVLTPFGIVYLGLVAALRVPIPAFSRK
jgi:putative peptidoglycan lipid II flippase